MSKKQPKKPPKERTGHIPFWRDAPGPKAKRPPRLTDENPRRKNWV